MSYYKLRIVQTTYCIHNIHQVDPQFSCHCGFISHGVPIITVNYWAHFEKCPTDDSAKLEKGYIDVFTGRWWRICRWQVGAGQIQYFSSSTSLYLSKVKLECEFSQNLDLFLKIRAECICFYAGWNQSRILPGIFLIGPE